MKCKFPEKQFSFLSRNWNRKYHLLFCFQEVSMAGLQYNGIDVSTQAILRVDTFCYRYDRYRCSAAATVMCQRVFLRHQPYYDHWEVATACMMIAKRNYTPNDAQKAEIFNYSFLLIHSGESFTRMVAPRGWKEKMLWVERMVLLLLQPDEMGVDLPHALFFYHTRFMQPHIRHSCYQLLNDGLLTTAFLVFPGHCLVAGALYAAKELFGYPFRDDWWELYGLTPDDVQAVGEFFCESQRIKGQSYFVLPSYKPSVMTLHTTVEELSQKLVDAKKEIQRLNEALAESHSTTN
ncbi:hypothetical protein MANES_07G123804v8 [Manihot esculenta]|uniref:Uncharacterized protein n=1 Tax=Manihot esculenta TaxID=3983 RepID=A0ACB7HHH1_MANES|nr:hypothetical protein MANES_07G123804v8 [Manihot esculenta]